MKATVYNAYYLFKEDSMNFEFPVEMHVSRFHNNDKITHPYYDGDVLFDNPDAYKVYMNTTEPVTSANRELIETVIKNSKFYDLILTTDEEILEKCENATMFPYGSTWLNRGNINHIDGLGEYDSSLNSLCENKKFEISFLCTFHRRDLDGYNKRKEIWENRLSISNPTLFYSSTRFPVWMQPHRMEEYSRLNSCDDGNCYMLPEDDKKYLFNSQFHIAIESTSTNNYFSEKLIDAMITKTVPIYWGCPNICDFFDTRGMIIEENITEACNNITPETYESMLPYIEDNYNRAKEYARPFSDRVKEMIEEKNEI